MPRVAAEQLHYEKMLDNKYKAKTHHPAFAAAPELSGEMGKSSDCRQAHTLQTTTNPTPARPTPYDCINKAAAATQQSKTKPTVKMPLDVLASTCESFPQPAHDAGEERLDQRTAKLDTAAALHQGHLCMGFSVAVHGRQEAIRWKNGSA